MIETLTLQNFKGHRDTELKLGGITVLVGPNGGGKTSVLEALEIMSELVATPWNQVLHIARAPELLLRRGSEDLKIHLATTGGEWFTSIDVRFSRSELEPRATEVNLKARTPNKSGSEKYQYFAEWNRRDPVLQKLGSARLFRFIPGAIAEPSWTEVPEPEVAADGWNTASVLMRLKIADDPRFDVISGALRSIVPHVERVWLKPASALKTTPAPFTEGTFAVERQRVPGHEIFFDFKNAPGLPAHLASEGTLIVLALLTAIYGPSRASLILIDDIERALHPMAQIELMRQLKTLVEQNPDVQIVATTHSPYILDPLDPDDVVVCFPRDDGSVKVRRLSEHPDAARVKGTLSAGQIWNLDPESWVLEEATKP